MLAASIESGQRPDLRQLAELQAVDVAQFGVDFMRQIIADEEAADAAAFGQFPPPPAAA